MKVTVKPKNGKSVEIELADGNVTVKNFKTKVCDGIGNWTLRLNHLKHLSRAKRTALSELCTMLQRLSII